MMCPKTSVEKVCLYPKPVDFRKSIYGMAVLVELGVKVAGLDPVLFVFLNRHGNRVKVFYQSAAASFRDGVESTRYRYPASDPRTLDYPVR